MQRIVSYQRAMVFRGVQPLLCRTFHPSVFAAKRVTEVVPALGESITEGTIARWNKNEGDVVRADDVVVIVETDKVTVDIKSNFSGKITKILASENVEVGKPLYEIETDDNVSVTTSAAPAPSASSSSSAVETATKNDTKHGSSSHRKPLIKFVGKRSLLKSHASSSSSSSLSTSHSTASSFTPVAASPVDAWPQPKKPQTGVHFTTLKDTAFYGRPKLSAKEIDAIESGGAY